MERVVSVYTLLIINGLELAKEMLRIRTNLPIIIVFRFEPTGSPGKH